MRYIQFPGVLFTLREVRKGKAQVKLTTAEHGTLSVSRRDAAHAIRAFRRAMRAYAAKQAAA